MSVGRLRASPFVAPQQQKIQKPRRPAPAAATPSCAPRRQAETVLVRRACDRGIRRSPANRRARCRRRAPGSESSRAGCRASDSGCGLVVAATVRTRVSRSARPASCATIITLRTNGERGDQCSFIMTSRAVTRHQYYDFRAANATLVPCRVNSCKHHRQWAKQPYRHDTSRRVHRGACDLVGLADPRRNLPKRTDHARQSVCGRRSRRCAGTNHHHSDGGAARPVGRHIEQTRRRHRDCGGVRGGLGSGRANRADVERVVPHRHAGAHQGQLRRHARLRVRLHDRGGSRTCWSYAPGCRSKPCPN